MVYCTALPYVWVSLHLSVVIMIMVYTDQCGLICTFRAVTYIINLGISSANCLEQSYLTWRDDGASAARRLLILTGVQLVHV
jgi:hypothetical protein